MLCELTKIIVMVIGGLMLLAIPIMIIIINVQIWLDGWKQGIGCTIITLAVCSFAASLVYIDKYCEPQIKPECSCIEKVEN